MFGKKIIALIAAVSMMTVGVACAESTTKEGRTVATATCEDGMLNAEASWTGVSRTDKFENGSVEASLGKADAAFRAGVSTDEDGKTTVEYKAQAEALLGEFGGTVGSKDSVAVGAAVEVGVGAHCDMAYEDGHVKLDMGAALGLGAGIKLDVNVGGAVDTVVEGAKVVGSAVADGAKAVAGAVVESVSSVCSFFRNLLF